jgi:hypothetical protein
MAKSETAVAKHEENAAKLPQAKDDSYDVSTGFLVGNEDSGLTISLQTSWQTITAGPPSRSLHPC